MLLVRLLFIRGFRPRNRIRIHYVNGFAKINVHYRIWIRNTTNYRYIFILPAFCCICLEEVWHCLHQLCLARGPDFWGLLGTTFSQSTTLSSAVTALEPNLEVMQYRRLPHQPDTGLPWNLTASLVTLFALAKEQKEEEEEAKWDPAALHKMLRGQLRSLFRDMEARLDEPRLRKSLQTVEIVLRRTGALFEIMADLWDFFRRVDRLNASFRGRSSTIGLSYRIH